MTYRRIWRIALLLIAVIMLAIPIITPLLELAGNHNHTCSAARCALCTVSGTLRTVTDASAVLFCILLPLIILITRVAASSLNHPISPETPIALKTKILS